MKELDWKKYKKPIIGLAPMADMTDSAFCQVVKSMADPVVFREMVSSEAIVRGNDKTLAMTKVLDVERPIIQQIFGSDPKVIAEAAKIIEKTAKPDGMDINMGCPAYKIAKGFNGAALMKDPELASKIVKAVKDAIKVPLSVKTRAGWADHQECIDFSKMLEDSGADLISIHGRTKTQQYSGKANWEVIRLAKANVSIPVLANGDIFSVELVQEALDQTGCDGVLIARGALGNPWIFKQAEELLSGKQLIEIDLKERIRIVKLHTELHCKQYGKNHGIRTFRKHLSWYFKGLRGVKAFRQKLVTVKTKKELFEILDEMKNK